MIKNFPKNPLRIPFVLVSLLLIFMTAFTCFLLVTGSSYEKGKKALLNTSLSKKGKTVVVTGASGEIGGTAAKELASSYHLILTGRDQIKLKALQEELEKVYPDGKYDVCPLDYSSEDSILRFQEYLQKKNIKVAGFVLIGPRPSFYGKDLFQDGKTWQTVFQECFIGPFASLKAAIPFFTEKSSVVALSGITSIELHPSSGPTPVIRAMVSAYTKALSKDFVIEGKKVRYNTISPGVVLTDYHEKRIKTATEKNGISYEEQMKLDVEGIPSGEHIKPADLAKVIAFLISEDSEGVNGVNLPCDGGWSRSVK